MSTMGNIGQSAKSMGEIEAGMNDIDNEIDRILDRLQNLHTKLGALMSPAIQSSAPAVPLREASSSFGQLIALNGQRLRQITNSLDDLNKNIQF